MFSGRRAKTREEIIKNTVTAPFIISVNTLLLCHMILMCTALCHMHETSMSVGYTDLGISKNETLEGVSSRGTQIVMM